jgi:hypothetical protein
MERIGSDDASSELRGNTWPRADAGKAGNHSSQAPQSRDQGQNARTCILSGCALGDVDEEWKGGRDFLLALALCQGKSRNRSRRQQEDGRHRSEIIASIGVERKPPRLLVRIHTVRTENLFRYGNWKGGPYGSPAAPVALYTPPRYNGANLRIPRLPGLRMALMVARQLPCYSAGAGLEGGDRSRRKGGAPWRIRSSAGSAERTPGQETSLT